MWPQTHARAIVTLPPFHAIQPIGRLSWHARSNRSTPRHPSYALFPPSPRLRRAPITRAPASTRRPPPVHRASNPPLVPIQLIPGRRRPANRHHGGRAPPRQRCKRRRPSPAPRPRRPRWRRKHGGARGRPRLLCRRDLVRLHLPGRPSGDSVSTLSLSLMLSKLRRTIREAGINLVSLLAGGSDPRSGSGRRGGGSSTSRSSTSRRTSSASSGPS